MERKLIPTLIDEVLDKVDSNFKENNEIITNDILLLLYGVFDKVLQGALELIESNAVTIMQIKNYFTKSDQFMFQVTGSSDTSYILFNRVNYCQCKFYQQKVLTSKSYAVCKHFLAANLAYSWHKCRKFTIDFDMYTDIVKNVLKTS